jgi:hypothetical protein
MLISIIGSRFFIVAQRQMELLFTRLDAAAAAAAATTSNPGKLRTSRQSNLLNFN